MPCRMSVSNCLALASPQAIVIELFCPFFDELLIRRVRCAAFAGGEQHSNTALILAGKMSVCLTRDDSTDTFRLRRARPRPAPCTDHVDLAGACLSRTQVFPPLRSYSLIVTHALTHKHNMAPNSRVIICRHSQATHNVADDYSLPDAPLTSPLGKQQAAKLPDFTTQLQGEVDLIITSPLKRTLQTTLLGWAPAVKRLGQQNVICLPQLQGECGRAGGEWQRTVLTRRGALTHARTHGMQQNVTLSEWKEV